MGLSGLGDLALTCGSHKSRNYALGVEIGRGRALSELMAGRHTVAEGVATATASLSARASTAVDMPIAAAVNAVLAAKSRVSPADVPLAKVHEELKKHHAIVPEGVGA